MHWRKLAKDRAEAYLLRREMPPPVLTHKEALAVERARSRQ